MRILHTADWHLCTKLGRIDRTADLRQRVETVAELCETHRVDTLLIAGDLFSDKAVPEQISEATRHLRLTFQPFFARGGTILAVTGNHDIDKNIEMIREGMSLAVPGSGAARELEPGRLYLFNRYQFATLPGPDGERVQFVFVPYPTASRFEGLSAEAYRSKEEENKLLHQHVAGWVQGVTANAAFDTSLKTVLMGHLHVSGSETHTLYKINDRDDVVFNYADLNPMWSYVALGHIHKPQCLGGSVNVRYSGSLDRLDFGETHDEHGVILFDLASSGPLEPVRLPIAATPFYTIAIHDPDAELPQLTDKYPASETAIVKVRVHGKSSGLTQVDITRKLTALFPRLLPIEWIVDEERDRHINPVTVESQADTGKTIHDYLGRMLENDPDRDEILKLADHYIAIAKEGAR
jgi:DNA repair protein SbcD/Mre11